MRRAFSAALPGRSGSKPWPGFGSRHSRGIGGFFGIGGGGKSLSSAQQLATSTARSSTQRRREAKGPQRPQSGHAFSEARQWQSWNQRLSTGVRSSTGGSCFELGSLHHNAREVRSPFPSSAVRGQPIRSSLAMLNQNAQHATQRSEADAACCASRLTAVDHHLNLGLVLLSGHRCHGPRRHAWTARHRRATRLVLAAAMLRCCLIADAGLGGFRKNRAADPVANIS